MSVVNGESSSARMAESPDMGAERPEVRSGFCCGLARSLFDSPAVASSDSSDGDTKWQLCQRNPNHL